MNFEKEARELLDVVSEDYSPTYIAIMEEALRKAYLSGQESMRAGAGKAVPTTWLDSLLSGKDGVKLPLQQDGVEQLLLRLRTRIISLPLQSNDEKELG